VFGQIEIRDCAAIALRKITLRLIPFLFLLYIVAWLDRVNLGFAALQMNAALGFSASTFGFGSGIFFVGYCLFEVPSNLVLHRTGARLWISRIMITWGVISAAMMFVHTPLMFYLLRFLLGVAEAGFFPGIIYYLSHWYPAVHRARAIAAFMTAVPVTGLIGGPVSGALLGLDGVCGLAGWQWLFLLEGLPAIVLGGAVLVYLPEKPESAGWLTESERDWFVHQLARDKDRSAQQHFVVDALSNRTVWQLGILFLLTAMGFFGYSFWGPLLIKSLLHVGNFGVGVISAGISAMTICFMLLNSAHSDRTRERALHVAVPLAITSVGFLGCVLLRQPVLAILALALVSIGHCGAYGPFWSMLTLFLSGAGLAGGVALVTSIAAFGGFLGPTVIGVLKDRTGTHNAAFILLAALGLLAAILAFKLRGTAVASSSVEVSRRT
jgi:ACS family tartrate transporter-like MFS transporter